VQVLNYIQLAWGLIITENNLNKNTEIYHGAVEAVYTVIGKFCVCVFCATFILKKRSQINRHSKARRRILGTFCCEPTKLKNKKKLCD